MNLFNRTPTPRPVSFAQRRMWFLDQLMPESPAYVIAEAFRLKGPLDTASLKRALSEIVARHEALRTTFIASDGRPTQIVAPPAPVELPVLDLSGTADPEDEARRRGFEEGRGCFDLARGPLLRALLMHLGHSDHVLLLTMHHIVTDGWSAGVLADELSVLYRAFREGRGSPLPDLAMQYADFAAWQRGAMQGDHLAEQLAYWNEKLRGCPPVLELATDRPRPAARAGRGATVPVRVPATVVSALEDMGRAQGATLFMLLFAAFVVLLARYSGQDDLAVGSPIAGRNHSSTEALIGFFVNTLVLRADLSGDPTFTELVARVREVALDAYDHQDLPFEMLVEAARPERNLSCTPLFQHLFVFQNTPKPNLALADVEVTDFRLEREGSMFDLTLDLSSVEGCVTGTLEYDTDLFDRETVMRLASHYLHLLDEVVADADRPVSTLELLNAVEREQLLAGFNDTASEFSSQTTHQLFEHRAALHPEAVALRDADGSLSYRQLNEAANRFAHHLQGLGVGVDSRVGICVSRGSAMVVAMLGALKAGGGYVPLDPDYPPDRLAFMLGDTAAAVLVTESRLLERVPGHQGRVVCLDTDGPAIASNPSTNPHSGAGLDNLAYVMYTSGSTGRPKGVMIEHRGVVSLLAFASRTFTERELEVVVAAASMCFDLSVFEVFVTLANGGSLYVAADLLDGGWHDARPTMVNAVPSVLAAVLADRDLPTSVITIVLGGEALPSDLVDSLRARTPVGTAPRRLVNIYGPTETTIFATAAEVGPAPISGTIGIGRPVANTRVYLLDRHLQPVPIGVTGELYIGGAGVGRGYLNQPQLDADRFVTDPFRPAERSRLYRSGDLARYRGDGTIDFVGRVDDQAKVRGFRIEPGEVRAALLTHPDVANAAVLTSEEPPGGRRLVAYVVADPAAVTSAGLRAHLERTLPRYMIPAVFVMVGALPRTFSGKLDRTALPPPTIGPTRAAQVAPRTDTERALASIWAEVLGLGSVGISDDFFDLGGHSLLAAHVVAHAERAFGKKLPLALILRTRTIEALARVLDQHDPDTLWRTLFPLKIGGSGLPIFCVHGLTGTVTAYRQILPYLSDDHPVYGIQCLGLDGHSTPHRRVEDMAAHYIVEIRAVQPQGPYVIVGICFGSLVAFEMAHQLTTNKGCDVALVALIDPTPLPVRTFNEKVRRRCKKFSGVASGDRLSFLIETFRLTGEMATVTARNILRRQATTVIQVNIRATGFYVPPTYDGKVVLYRSGGLRALPAENRALAWETLRGANVEVVDIPAASHLSLLTEGNIPTIGRHLRDSVDRAVTAVRMPGPRLTAWPPAPRPLGALGPSSRTGTPGSSPAPRPPVIP